ncbi:MULTISPECIES: glycosyltransferase family 4 protein [unclassified Paenibacillus]|uniref:glycosyltransferase family 4 protein n=1 Tax=unclassified Paenibacillus TaxID=185978 RepID=UPI002405F160|nr:MULTISPECIES: glycosyltransferase family 4 protein [unclassified Paenibacillus]MDF9844987.1 glycosyltransferase involved in cell wall biosynthesis [Paenibacillus sp. PastF-2]MDF9851586.1 glycosyltransferase involved in cell wall biosynthesis [Paenibacillus sp. PastM-2]MDF9858170.1 glycosyltransferase involved in cell wall biosynthesis [Paenibacillus sp. PastF-1]MDH6483396.1 glycosyltransferase involved in cell wall biosynthesis [Paenibacillus sp. PastH-2]MDH6510846.1 glycosyltransferase inv
MADKATIVLFSHVSNTRSITGAEKLLLFFARELSCYFNCILVAPQDGKLTQQARKAGLNVQIIPIPLVYGVYTPYAGLEADIRKFQEGREYLELKDWLAALRPAFILSNTCVHVLPALAAKSLGIPVVWKISETITDNEYTGISVELIHRNSDEILAISHTAAACFPQEIRDSKVTQLPPSWNDQELLMAAWSTLRGERRRELRVAPGEPLIGYISSFINKEKGLEHFIKMAVLVSEQHPEAKYVVIGTPGDKSYYERCVRKVKLEGLTSRFKFYGYEDSLPSAYCAMDLLVVPSLIREGFGMTALEGMAFGKPVVAYDSGGLCEVLQAAGCGGLLAPAADISALAARVNSLLAEPGLAAATGSQARERIDAAYGPAAYRMRLLGLAERWQLRYCLAPPEPGGAEPAPPAALPAGGGEPAARTAPPPAKARRAARLRRAKLRRGRLSRAKARARRGKRPGRKRRAGGSARRKSSRGQKHRGRKARRRGRSR